MDTLDTIVLIFIVVLAILGGSYSRENTRRKRDRMINDAYDRKYHNKK